MERAVKLVVFVPPEAEEAVRLALAKAGAGRIGEYDCCAFVTPGTGHYRPLAGASPYHGQRGRVESVPELRIEVICAETLLPQVLQAMRDAHPCEEIAHDIIPLLNHQYRHLVPSRPVSGTQESPAEA